MLARGMLTGLPSSDLSVSYLEPGDRPLLSCSFSSTLPLGVEYGDGGGTINFCTTCSHTNGCRREKEVAGAERMQFRFNPSMTRVLHSLKRWVGCQRAFGPASSAPRQHTIVKRGSFAHWLSLKILYFYNRCVQHTNDAKLILRCCLFCNNKRSENYNHTSK